MKTNAKKIGRGTVAALGVAGVALSGLSGCRGERTDAPPRQFLPDMDDSPKFKPQTENPFFADGRTMRPVVPGTVAFGATRDPQDFARARFLKESPQLFLGIDPGKPKDAEGFDAYLTFMPASVIDGVIAEAAGEGRTLDRDQAFSAMVFEGKKQFNISCAVCHGYMGDGQGTVGVRWNYAVPNLHDVKYRDRAVRTGTDGWIFHVIRNGVAGAAGQPNKMPAYGYTIDEQEAWAIVAYVRVLQASWVEQGGGAPKAAGEGGQSGSSVSVGARTPEVVR
jgi:mono/diheme cytochrome c family protein